MGLGIIITLVGFIGSVALLFGLVWYLMTLGGEESDASLIAQNKANPLQKKAKGKDLRPWAAILVLGGFLTVSTTTIFVFSSKSATDSLNQMFSAVWEIEAKPSDFLVTVEEEEILDPPPSEPPWLINLPGSRNGDRGMGALRLAGMLSSLGVTKCFHLLGLPNYFHH